MKKTWKKTWRFPKSCRGASKSSSSQFWILTIQLLVKPPQVEPGVKREFGHADLLIRQGSPGSLHKQSMVDSLRG
jgi:hypothetical protein